MGLTEILIVAAVVVLIAGGSRIPPLLRALGEAKAGYKRGLEGKEDGDAEIVE